MTFDPATSSLTVNTPGRYLIKARVFWLQLPRDGFRRIDIEAIVAEDVQTTADVFENTQEVSTIVQLSAGDVITLQAFNTEPAEVIGWAPEGVFVAPQLQAELLQP